MKKLLILFASLLFLWSCKKSSVVNVPNTPVDGPETKAQFDHTSFGVYKGVIVGSSGTIKLVIDNGDNIVRAYLNMTDLQDTLICNQTFTTGQAITNAEFTGSHSSMTFNAGANGQDPSIVNITIDGHSNVSGIIVHETSTQQVFCYEGAYAGDAYGTFNCIRFDLSVLGIGKDSNGQVYQGNGDITNGSLDFSVGITSSGATFQGTFSSTGCSGTWADTPSGSTGTFSGTRTL